jgi:hypothetical protein
LPNLPLQVVTASKVTDSPELFRGRPGSRILTAWLPKSLRGSAAKIVGSGKGSEVMISLEGAAAAGNGN